MIESIESLRAAASAQGTKRLAVACAQDDHVLLAVDKARRLGIAEAILVGCEQQIRRIAAEHALDLTPYRIIDEPDNAAACRIAVSLVKNGEADAVMKGLVDTAVILKAVLDKENGLRDAKVLSHVALFEVPGFDRLLLLTDSAMNIAPDLETKKEILRNAVRVANALGNENPVVACLCAVEKVNPKMPATVDAAELKKLGEAGEFGPNVLVEGPIAMDLAVSAHCAEVKGFKSEVAGDADIFIVPNIEAGNIMGKTLGDILGAKAAGVIVGTDTPIVMCSRADNDETKLCSIALGCLMAGLNK